MLVFTHCGMQNRAPASLSGALDGAFGVSGFQLTSITEKGDTAQAVAIQADGKIVVGGYGNLFNIDFALSRYSPDGQLDPSFGNQGKVTTAVGASSDLLFTLAIQPDGKILVAGRSWDGNEWDLIVARYDASGTLDSTFGSAGIFRAEVGAVSDQAKALAVRGDGRIYVVGSSHDGTKNRILILRLTAGGLLDTGWNGTGYVTTTIGTSGGSGGEAVGLQADGKLLVAAFSHQGTSFDFSLLRYRQDGTLDSGFGGDGVVTTAVGAGNDVPSAVAVQSDGKILVVGYTESGYDSDIAVLRYDTSGSLDSEFHDGGIVTTAVGTGESRGLDVCLQSDGRILVSGYAVAKPGGSRDFSVTRYHSDGALDTTFGVGGSTLVDLGPNDMAYSLAIQPDGKVLLAGGNGDNFAIARFLP